MVWLLNKIIMYLYLKLVFIQTHHKMYRIVELFRRTLLFCHSYPCWWMESFSRCRTQRLFHWCDPSVQTSRQGTRTSITCHELSWTLQVWACLNHLYPHPFDCCCEMIIWIDYSHFPILAETASKDSCTSPKSSWSDRCGVCGEWNLFHVAVRNVYVICVTQVFKQAGKVPVPP